MFIVDLICDAGHLFEGWYDNRDAFDDVRADGSLRCPSCGNEHIEQRPSFRGIAVRSSSTKPKQPTKQPTNHTHQATQPTPTTQPTTDQALDKPRPSMPLEMQQALSQLIKLVKAHSDDVGERFAERAIAMHKGDEEPALIHGTSTPDDEQTLRNEGVPFAKIPIPEIDDN